MKINAIYKFAAVYLLLQLTALALYAQTSREVNLTAHEADISVSIQGRNGSLKFESTGFRYGANSPANVQADKQAGRSMAKAILIEKKLDSSSPQLSKMMTTGEKLNSVVIEFHKKGQASAYEIIHLYDALISKVVVNENPPNPQETITLVYNKIEINNIDNGKTDVK